MWLFTTDGFFSAVENKKDSNLIHVRSRWKEDLENLKRALIKSSLESTFDYPLHRESNASWNNGMKALEIIDTPSADYPFRIDVPRDEWIIFVTTASLRINYSNFKEAIAEKEESNDRLERYHNVWQILRDNSPVNEQIDLGGL